MTSAMSLFIAPQTQSRRASCCRTEWRSNCSSANGWPTSFSGAIMRFCATRHSPNWASPFPATRCRLPASTNLTNRLSQNAARGGASVDVVDVLAVQLRNLRGKLPKNAPVRLLAMDATALELPDASYENCLVFFLLHEQPRLWREHTVREVLRVVKPGGKIVIVDYARPRWWHPLRYLWRPLLAKLEPFALDLWSEEIVDWLPQYASVKSRKQVFFGGLYQKLVIIRQECTN